MNVVSAIFSFICLSFFIVIIAVILLAIYLKSRMAVFKEVQEEEEAFNNGQVIDTDYYTVGADETPSPPTSPSEIILSPKHDDHQPF